MKLHKQTHYMYFFFTLYQNYTLALIAEIVQNVNFCNLLSFAP